MNKNEIIPNSGIVSVILTTLNNKNSFEQCIKSVLQQDYPKIEIIIKDGKSTDGTIQLAERFVKQSDRRICLISTCDSGIYDAMNQGYRHSTGEYVLFFNDEFTTKDAISKLVNATCQINPVTKSLYKGAHADLAYVRDHKRIRIWMMGKGRISAGWMPAHPTLLLRREVYEKYGLFATNYKVSGDYDFMVRFLKKEPQCLNYVHEVLVNMEYGGASNASYLKNALEAYRALKCNRVMFAGPIILLRTIRLVIQFFKARYCQEGAN